MLKQFLLLFLPILIVNQTLYAKEPSLKQKIGQMMMVGFKGTEVRESDGIVKAILAQQVGGVVLFDYDVSSRTFDRNIKNPVQLKYLTEQLQNYAALSAKQQNQHATPLLIALDYEGGKVNRLKDTYGFPKTITAAKFGKLSRKDAVNEAQQMAKTLHDVGINFNLAPVVDVNVNPESPAIGKLERSFSADGHKVAAYAGFLAKAYQTQHIACAYKHFPGHGSATNDSHLGFVDVTQTWQERELLPYKMLMTKPYTCGAVMSAHVVHYGLDSKGHPATLSHAMMQELLREKLGFNGVIISDDMQMKAITDHYGLREALRLSINAGVDLIIFANQNAAEISPNELVEMVYEDVQTGKIRESRINDAYQRIMQLKATLTA